MGSDKPVVAILTRAPSSGGKKRLFAELDRPSDITLLQAMLLDTLDGARVPGARCVVAVTPASAREEIRDLVGDVDVIAQPDGDLGMRMRSAMQALFDEGAPAVVLIGSDLPHIERTAVAQALTLATRDRNALVLGPADDGGYYLIAAQRVPDVFAGVAWGERDVLTRTAQLAAAQGFDVHRVGTLMDVDTVEGLRAAALSGHAPRTADWVRANS